MKIVAVIPSRYGSTRFEGKPLALIAGKPMIQHVYENATRAKQIEEVVVATDHPRIADTVTSFGGKVIMTKPDNRSGTDRAAEAADKMGLAMEDIVINVQGDQPFVNPLCFAEVVTPLLCDSQLDMSTLAFRIIEPDEYPNPAHCKVVLDKNGYALYFSRAGIPFVRDAEDTLEAYRHLGIYAYPRRFLELFRKLPLGRLEQMEKLEQLRVLENGFRIKVIVTLFDSPEVDLPQDIARIEKEILKSGSRHANA